MKWFKHHTNTFDNDKLGIVEEKFGLIGYAAYFKILELCASNWDELSDPVFTFSSKQIQNKLRMKSDKTDLILGLFHELKLFQITKTENKTIIRADKMVKIKARYQKKATENPQESNPNKNKDKEERNKNKEKEKEKEINKENICSFQNLENSISFTEVTNLFNQKLPREFSNKGRVKYAPNFANNTLLEKFDQILGHTDFKGPEGWIKLFNEVLESDFLMGISEKNFVVTLDWLLDTSNIRKVLGGQYSNGKDFARQESDARLNKMLDEYYANKVD